MSDTITREIAVKVLETVDAGLVNGIGNPTPGQMCVEAAVCYAMGLPHSDKPSCVAPALRELKIALNDKKWSSPEARAKGLRRLAVAQLGSAGAIDEKEFLKRVVQLTIGKMVPLALRAAASVQKNVEYRQKMLDAANRCEAEKSREAAEDAADAADADAAAAAYAAATAAYAAAADDAAYSAAYSAAAAADAAADADDDAAAYAADDAADAAAAADAYAKRDEVLADFAEGVVQILIAMNAPGCAYLDLTEAA